MKKLIYLIMLCLSVCALCSVSAQGADEAPSAGYVATAEGNLNVRSSPQGTGQVVSTLKKGSYVTLLGKSSQWWRVEYAKGRYGYCYGDYISQMSSQRAAVKISSGSLNVRNGAGIGFAVTDSLTKGEEVLVLSENGSWSRILYRGTKTGYVSSGYLSLPQASPYPAVKLSVPSYKQTDSRWANVKIGSSGKTIAQIGCATTAIAMIESYRSGRTIYPDEMSKKLSYSSSGSVYWPADYKVSVSSSGYLLRIYSELKAGRPVLIGAKNSNGSQHWVVVTGFTGAETLSAAAFTINDPGSKTRTTLSQFLSAYPTFYKYFCY